MKKEDDRYEDCDACGERYVGEDAIRSYLREVEVGGEVQMLCRHSCAAQEVADDLAFDADREQSAALVRGRD